MLTVKHQFGQTEHLYEVVGEVCFKKETKEVSFTEPFSEHRVVLEVGKVYVMNEAGSTIGTYYLA
jgi:hypothetical protein